MLIPVLIISSLVHVYSLSYMQSDPQAPPRILGVYLPILASALKF